MRRLAPCAALLALLLAIAPSAGASPSQGEGVAARAPIGRGRGRRRSVSVGLPWQGRLERGVHLDESRHVRHVPEYAAGAHHFGAWQLVQLLERAAERVHQRLPGGRLSVGEISAQAGGHLDGHRSHQSGRDVDVGFYMIDAQGRPYDAYAFAEFGADGRGLGPNRMLRFDDARNWELIGRLVTDGDARVQHVFVSSALQRRLLREGRQRRAPASVLARAARVMSQPGHHPHRNHFHVRVYCGPHERRACRDRAPFHEWYPGRPPLES